MTFVNFFLLGDPCLQNPNKRKNMTKEQLDYYIQELEKIAECLESEHSVEYKAAYLKYLRILIEQMGTVP